MENMSGKQPKAGRPGRVLGVLALVAGALRLAELAYFAASNTIFLTEMSMLSFPALVFGAAITALAIAATLLSARYPLACVRAGMRSEQALALYPVHTFSIALHGIYAAVNIVLMFLPSAAGLAALLVQNFFGDFYIFVPYMGFQLALVVASDVRKIKPEKPADAQAKAQRRGTLLRYGKTAALWGVLGAVSLAYIFSGAHSITSIRSNAFTAFTAEDLAGEPVDQTIFADHDLTLINIWATFCGPCLGEMPDLAALHEEYGDRGFQVVGICADIVDPQTGALYPDLYQKALELEKQTGAEVYRNLNPAGDILQNYVNPTVSAFPTSVFVNAQGEQVGDMIVGSCDKARWTKEIEDRLAMVHGDSAA